MNRGHSSFIEGMWEQDGTKGRIWSFLMRQIKDSEMHRVCSTRITENTHNILVIKHEGETPLRKILRRRDNNRV